MYKLMIVDDEYVVIESIQNTIRNHFDTIEVVGSAESGTEFIEKVYKLQPDIVFMDIEMSDMTGLDAIEKVKGKIDTKFIILTAYDYFSYSKRALKAGVKDYLLKPFDQDEIIQSVTNVMRNIGHEEHKKGIEAKMKNQLNQSLDLIEQECIEKIIMYQENEKPTIEAFLDMMKIDMSYSSAILVKFEAPVLKETSQYIKSTIKKTVLGLCGEVTDSVYCIVMPLSYQMSEAERKSYKKYKVNKLYQSLTVLIGMKPIIVIGYTMKGLEGAHDSYHQAKKTLDQCDVSQGVVFTTMDLEVLDVDNASVDNGIWYLEKVMFGRMKLAEKEPCLKSLNELLLLITKFYDFNSELVKIKMIELAVEIYRFAQRETIKQDPVKLNYGGYLGNLFTSNEKAIRHHIIESVSYICDHIYLSGNENLSKLKEVKTFVLAHFNEDIKVEEIANRLYISQSYLSKKFKDTFGESCSDFIIRVRIEKAIEYLENTNMSVKEIAYEVGYEDPNYFCRLFKKKTGHVAGDFREHYRL